jgi:glycosyltransferase involved in cell wall biosynthesis
VITAVGVVVPAHDEEALLPACLASVRAALDRVRRTRGVVTRLVVVLDACRDGSAAVVAGRPDVVPILVAHRNVGAARAAGVDAVARLLPGRPAGRVWVATTDADSTVPPDWLTTQLDLADRGAAAVVGTVTVTDWSGHPDSSRARWTASYVAAERHPHVHGANLGATLAAYHAAGGFPPLATGEDVTLVHRLAEVTGSALVRTATVPVVTSSRRRGRAADGFADHLRGLAGTEHAAEPGMAG